MSILLIDDKRNINADYIARNYNDAIEALQMSSCWDLVMLDHDLGDFEDGKERTGYDILCWLEQNPEYIPKEILIITDNASAYMKMKKVADKLLANKK
jgi:CheY-like chemotaxis protein